MECAALLMETVPLVMRTVRAEMRHHRSSELSIPQFRVLVFLYHRPGASLSQVADHIGLTLPSMSKTIDKLVARKLLRRNISPKDRRCVTLTLTGRGKSTLRFAREETQVRVAAILAPLSGPDRNRLLGALQSLYALFLNSQDEARAEGSAHQ